jgi:hypothetical protein
MSAAFNRKDATVIRALEADAATRWNRETMDEQRAIYGSSIGPSWSEEHERRLRAIDVMFHARRVGC